MFSLQYLFCGGGPPISRCRPPSLHHPLAYLGTEKYAVLLPRENDNNKLLVCTTQLLALKRGQKQIDGSCLGEGARHKKVGERKEKEEREDES